MAKKNNKNKNSSNNKSKKEHNDLEIIKDTSQEYAAKMANDKSKGINLMEKNTPEKSTVIEPEKENSTVEEELVVVQQDSKARNIIAAILALIFVGSVGLLAFRYFNSVNEINSMASLFTSNSQTTNVENAPDSQSNTQNGAGTAKSNEQIAPGSQEAERNAAGEILQGISSVRESIEEAISGVTDSSNNQQNNQGTNTATNTGQKPQVEEKPSIDGQDPNYVNIWEPNDYQPGDISEGEYTVQSGDTLWEIAEAAYGDGSQWVQILNANADQVDFLANGQQALIYSGQTLTIPSI